MKVLIAIAFVLAFGVHNVRADEPASPQALGYAFRVAPLAAVPAGVAFPDTSTARPRKSRVLGALYSAAVPGMGELYAGDYSTGRWFTTGEVLLWLGYAAMTMYGNSITTDASTYATDHAGAQTSGKDDQYLTNVGNFSNTGLYNDKKARDGDYRLIYTTSTYNWQWDTDDNRVYFRSMHLRANNILDNTKYLAAAIVVNHIASAVDAVLLINRINKGVHIGAAPTIENGQWGTKVSVSVGL